ncbi:hypothetical protein [Oligosphaera ethanolica]|uniref:Uncharacterized protein n=1 Tax=Oligosphaera ethanolica TaxID=760260 RepID=A0AAE3VI98_9BACT|nr:hypothetical protein [Oligosphaera ethanolica]MDQ0290766.1 hypothetical protein [Oligosphaera ethanolica]
MFEHENVVELLFPGSDCFAGGQERVVPGFTADEGRGRGDLFELGAAGEYFGAGLDLVIGRAPDFELNAGGPAFGLVAACGMTGLDIVGAPDADSTQSALAISGEPSGLAKTLRKPPASGPMTLSPVLRAASAGKLGRLPGLPLLSAKRTS